MPKGSFCQLLLAKTEERSKIFREIFHTEPYQKLQEALRTEAAQWKSTYESLSQKIQQHVEQVQPGPEWEEAWREAVCLEDGEMLSLLEKILQKETADRWHFRNKSRHCRLKGKPYPVVLEKRRPPPGSAGAFGSPGAVKILDAHLGETAKGMGYGPRAGGRPPAADGGDRGSNRATSAYVLLEDLEKERNTVFDQMQKGAAGKAKAVQDAGNRQTEQAALRQELSQLEGLEQREALLKAAKTEAGFPGKRAGYARELLQEERRCSHSHQAALEQYRAAAENSTHLRWAYTQLEREFLDGPSWLFGRFPAGGRTMPCLWLPPSSFSRTAL